MPVKSFEQVQAEEAARKQQLVEQAQARREQLNYFEQIAQRRQAEQAERDHEHELFMRRVEYSREHPRAIDKSTMPTWEGYYQQKAVEEQAAAAEAERQRLASRTPREVWMSTLSWQDRQHVLTWEAVNRTPFPVPGLED